MGPRRSLSINQDFVVAEDGTRIAYRAEGRGPALVLTNGLTTTTTFWDHTRPRWLASHRVVTWDLPGHGASEPARTRAGARFEALAAVVARVMDAAEVERATQVGWSTGSQIAFELQRRFPRRSAALVSVLGPAGHVLDTTALPIGGGVLYRLLRHTPTAVFASAFRVMVQRADSRSSIALGRRLGLIGPETSHGDARRLLAHLRELDPASVRWLALSAQEHSAHDLLGQLGVPLLVVAGERDPFAPAERVGVPLHRAAPGSELLRLPSGTHTALLDHGELIAEQVADFVRRRVA